MEEETQRVMSQVPKTAAGFNRDFKALKKNTEQQMAFLRKIPAATLQGYFKSTELEAATFGEVLHTLAEHVTTPEDCTWAHGWMTALSKAFKFDTTMMFASDDEIAYANSVIEKIRAVDGSKADQLSEKYTD